MLGLRGRRSRPQGTPCLTAHASLPSRYHRRAVSHKWVCSLTIMKCKLKCPILNNRRDVLILSWEVKLVITVDLYVCSLLSLDHKPLFYQKNQNSPRIPAWFGQWLRSLPRWVSLGWRIYRMFDDGWRLPGICASWNATQQNGQECVEACELHTECRRNRLGK